MSVWGPYKAEVVSVHDGDTMRLLVDVGFGLTVNLACRLYGINAPELSTQAGKDARDYLQSLVKPGDQVSVFSHGWDKYGGRFDGEVLKGTSDLGELMVETGHAVPMP